MRGGVFATIIFNAEHICDCITTWSGSATELTYAWITCVLLAGRAGTRRQSAPGEELVSEAIAFEEWYLRSVPFLKCLVCRWCL